MKAIPTLLALVALAAPSYAGNDVEIQPVPECDTALTASLNLGYSTRYNYRGVVSDKGVTDHVFSYGLRVQYEDKWCNTWFVDGLYRNLDTVDPVLTKYRKKRGGYERPPITLPSIAEGQSERRRKRGGYGYRLQTVDLDDHVTINVGVTREVYPDVTGTLWFGYNSGGVYLDENGQKDDGTELGLRFDWDVMGLGFINAHVLGAYEFSAFDGGHYLEAGVDATFNITERVDAVLGLEVGSAHGYFPTIAGVDNDNFNHWAVTLKAPVKLSETFTFAPYVSYVGALGTQDDYNAALGGAVEAGAVVAGIEATLSF